MEAKRYPVSRAFFAFLFVILSLAPFGKSWGQVNIAPGGTITESFTIGTSPTASLPTYWKVDKNASVRTVGTYSAAGSNTELVPAIPMPTNASNGIYNLVSGSSGSGTDRAIGWLSSGTATKSGNLYLYLNNNGSSNIASFTISYNIEKHRNGSNAAGFSIQMYYSTDGSNWTSAGSSFLTSFSADADNNGYNPAPGSTTSINAKTLTVTVSPSSKLYLAWNYSVTSGTTTSNAQALGVDDVSILANAAASNDQTSKVVDPTTQTAAGDIASTATSSGSAVDVFKFKISDLGTADGLATKVTQVKIKKSSGTADWTDHIAGASLWDGASQITTGTVTITDADITFPITSGNLDIANNTNKDITLKIWLNTANIVDNSTMAFTVSQTSHGFTADAAGSGFASDFGAAVTGNTMTVRVAATKLSFTTAPSVTACPYTNLSTEPVVKAMDANGTTDADNNSLITLSNSSGIGMINYQMNAVAGVASFASLQFTATGSGTLSVSAPGLTGAGPTSSITISVDNATSVAATNGNAASAVSWTNPVCYDELMIVGKAGSAVTLAPSGDGTSYSASLAFGSGTAYDGGFVLYKGTSSSQTVTGLTNGTTYYFTFFTRKGSIWSSGVSTSATPVLASSTTDHFRSVSSDYWSNNSAWQSSTDGSTNWINATLTPTSSANSITIQSGHNILLNSSLIADQLTIQTGGSLTVYASNTLTINNGTGTDLTINGSLTNNGSVTLQGTTTNIVNGTFTNAGTLTMNTVSTSLTVNGVFNANTGSSISNSGAGPITFSAGSQYNHNLNGGTIPTAAWASTSTCNVTGMTSTPTSGVGQSFGNFIWDCAQTGTNYLNINNPSFSTAGALTIANTGTAGVCLCYNNTTAAYTYNFGSLNITGGLFQLLYRSGTNDTYPVYINVTGDVTVSNTAEVQFGNAWGNVTGTIPTSIYYSVLTVGGNLTIGSSALFNCKGALYGLVLFNGTNCTYNNPNSVANYLTNNYGIDYACGPNTTLTLQSNLSLYSSSSNSSIFDFLYITGTLNTGIDKIVNTSNGTYTDYALLGNLILPLTFTSASGSQVLTAGNTTDVYVGMGVSGIGIAANTYVTDVLDAAKLLISKPATATATNTLTFTSLSKLVTGNVDGIQATGNNGAIQTGNRYLDNTSDFLFNGSSDQSVGTAITAARNINLSNTAGKVSLSGNVAVSGTLTVPTGNTLDAASYVISGVGDIDLQSGGTFMTSHPSGLNGNNTTTGGLTDFSSGAKYVYYGTTAQVTGSQLPATIYNLTIDNSGGVSLSNTALTVSNNLTINSGKLFNIDYNKQVNVNGSLINNGDETSLIIKSTAGGTGSLIHNTNNVKATIQRYITGNTDIHIYKYHFVSIPLIPSNNSVSGLFYNSYLWDFLESENRWRSWGTPTTHDLNETRGYILYYRFSDTTYQFPGPINNGDFDATVTFTEQGDAINEGWNLVPNPYASGIDWDLVSMSDRPNVEAGIYIWPADNDQQGGSSSYYYYVGGVSSPDGALDGTIPIGQSFMVHANGGGTPSLTFKNSHRVHSSQTYLKKTENTVPNLLYLIASDSTKSDQTAIRFLDDATENFDGEWDAYKFLGGQHTLNICSISGDGFKLAINSLPTENKDIIIPIYFYYTDSAMVTIKAANLQSFDSIFPIYFEDKLLDKRVDLRNEDYIFEHNGDTVIDRFQIRFNITYGIDEHSIVEGKVFMLNGKLNIDIPEFENKKVSLQVLDLTGKTILSSDMKVNGNTQTDFRAATGYYIVRISDGRKQFVGKLFVI